MTEIEGAPNIRAEKTRRIIAFWKAHPKGTLSEAMEKTGCARSACQRWRTTLRRQGKLGDPLPSQDGVGFFDRFKPRPPREESESPRASASTSSSSQSDTHGTSSSPPAPAPPHPEPAEAEASGPPETVDDVVDDQDEDHVDDEDQDVHDHALVKDAVGDEPSRRRDVEFRLW